MAKNHSPIQLSGTIGDLTFYRTRNGSFVKRKPSLSKKTVESSPRYSGLHAHRSAFGEAIRAAHTLRRHLLPFIGIQRDSTMQRRLNRLFLQAAHLYGMTPKDQRHGPGIGISLLQGFECNNTTSLSAVLHAGISGNFDRSMGNASVSVASFVPEDALKYPAGATHVRISMAAAAVNFATREVQKQFIDGDYLPISKQPTGSLTLPVSLPANLPDPLLLLLKLQYFREVNGDMLERFNASCCTCTILKVIS